MAKIHFVLRSAGKGKETNQKQPRQIYLCYRFGKNDKLMFPTGFKTSPEYWNNKECRLRKTSLNPEKERINNYLNELEVITSSFITKLIIDKKELTKQGLKDFLQNYLHPQTININTFLGYFQNFIDKADQRTNATGKRISYKRIRGYYRTFELIKEFCNLKKKIIDFQDIDLDFYQEFTIFLQSKKVKKEGENIGMSTNTIGNKIQCIKVVLNEATEKGINTNLYFKSQKFKTISEDNDNIYLTINELNKLISFDFSNKPKLEKVVDLFLIGAFTGLRFSDFVRINQDNIRGNRIYIEQQKTSKQVVIPCNPVFIKIWEKYNGNIPKVISNQKFNDYIKEACRMAGINESFHKGITKGGKRISKKYEKWELVSSHTARRSFATNQFKMGVPAIVLMNITGHKTERAFLRYIKATPEDYVSILESHWNTNNPILKVV